MVMVDSQFWHGKRVFITGHTGFKGGWIVQWLLLMKAEVCGYALEAPTEPSLFKVLELRREIKHFVGDIRDCVALSQAMVSFKPDIVFHFAAQPLVRLSYKEPRLTYETNVMGTLNLYEAVRKCDSVRVVVSITTDKCYENKEWVWGYREDDPMGGYDPYSSSKACAEILSAAYRRSFFNPKDYGREHVVALATARAGNVVGGGDWALDRLIPDCIRSLVKNESISIRSPRATRPWQHVLDPISGYLRLAEKMWADGISFCEGWNFGPGDAGVMDVESVVRTTIDAWGSGSYSINSDADMHEAQLLKLDPSKARARLGWATKVDARKAISLSVEWYKAFYQHEDIKQLTAKQIATYQEEV